jgi:ABC-2 type transport system permease protein
LIRAVPFPTMVLPLSGVLSMFFFFLCGFGIAVVMMIAARPTNHSGSFLPLIQVPLLMVLQLMIVIGVSLMASCIGVKYRDFAELLPHALHACFFLSPVLYGIDVVQSAAVNRFGETTGGTVFALYMLNPFAGLITGYRDAMFYGEFLDAKLWIVLIVEAVALFVLGYLIYQHYDRRVVKFL